MNEDTKDLNRKNQDNGKKAEPQEAQAVTEEVTEQETNSELLDSIIEEDNKKIAELTTDLQRTRADFENFRRQNEIQREQYANSAKYATVKKVLPLIDDFERAIAAQPKELKPLEKNLEKTLKNLGLERIESSIGTEFNPDLHNAISVEGEGEQETIAEVLLSGFYYEGEVLRAAMVRVAKS